MWLFAAFGSVCFNVRIGCLEPLVPPDSDAFQAIRSVDNLFEAVQETLFAFPWYAIYRSKIYRQYFNATKTCIRLATICCHVIVNQSTNCWDLKMDGYVQRKGRM